MSEVASFRQQQALEEESAHNGLHGTAIVGNHASIIARIEKGADTLFRFRDEGRDEEALALWESASFWS
jgi:hypothetical protein